MSTATPDIIKSFLPIFYISKLFGCSLYSLPRPLNATNTNTPLTAIDVLLCVIQFALYFFMIIPLSKKWDSYDSIFNNEYATQIGSSGLVIIVFIGKSLHYIVTVTNLFVIIMDMRNSAGIRRVMLSLIEFDKQVSLVWTIALLLQHYQSKWVSWVPACEWTQEHPPTLVMLKSAEARV